VTQTALNTTSTALQTVQNKRPEQGCANKRSDPPELSKVSSEVETCPTRTTSYNVRNNNRKTECDNRQRSKNPDIFGKLKNPPRRNSVACKKEETSGKTRTFDNRKFYQGLFIGFPANKIQ
jgi:hypothetical protein